MPDRFGMPTDQENLAERDRRRQADNEKMHADHEKAMKRLQEIEESRRRNLEILEEQDRRRRKNQK